MTAHVTSNGQPSGSENDANNNTSVPPSSSSSVSNLSKSSRWPSGGVLQKTNQEGLHFPKFTFDPDSSLVCYWTAAVALATLYNAWTIALRIAFPEIREESGQFYFIYIDILSDFIYLMDIVMQLRIAYLQDGIPVFDPKKIRQQYMSQTYFVQDVISVLPSQTILSLLPDALGYCKYFLCTAGAARLTKLLKFHILYKFYDLAESFTSNPHLIRVIRLFLNLAIIIHWIACLYYLLSEYEGLGSNQWVYTNATEQQRFSRKYIVCLYWSAMTLTTIGNTNSPETDVEYIFTGVIFLTGVFVFATVMGNVGDVISSMNANRQEFQARMDHIQMYLTHKKVPASLQLKIKKWAEYTWSRTKATDESRLLNMLPERLRAEVAVHVHLDNLKKVKIFEQCETGFLCELVLKLRSQVFSPGDYVCRVGETGREMFIINHGKVEVLVPSPATNKDMVVAVLSEGNYFGEISLLRLEGVQNRRTADVRSIGYSELLCLSRRDLMAALVEYPEAKSVLEAQAKKRMKTNLQAQRAFSVDTLLRSSQDYSSMDSGIVTKDESRGHDVSEIKAMIEELKNANKVPGRTVWQLIARCEVLQVKLSEKEREVEDSRQRIKDLEQLLFSRHTIRHCETSESPQDKTQMTSSKYLRPSSKVIKQFSQDEGRLVCKDMSDSSTNDTPEVENKVIPDVKITRPASETGSSTEGDSEMDKKYIFNEDNFIKTSKITNVSYDKAPSYKFHQKSTPQLTESVPCDTAKQRPQVKKLEDTYKELSSDESNVRFFSQNFMNFQSSFHCDFSNETSVDHRIFLEDSDRICFSSSIKDEIYFHDPLGFNVPTIPEESDEEVDDNNPASSSSREYLTENSQSVNFTSKTGSMASDIRTNNNNPGQLSSPIAEGIRHAAPQLSSIGSDKGQQLVQNYQTGKKPRFSVDPFESDEGINFLKMGSLSGCFSDELNPRRNSWTWDSDRESEEDTVSS